MDIVVTDGDIIECLKVYNNGHYNKGATDVNFEFLILPKTSSDVLLIKLIARKSEVLVLDIEFHNCINTSLLTMEAKSQGGCRIKGLNFNTLFLLD